MENFRYTQKKKKNSTIKHHVPTSQLQKSSTHYHLLLLEFSLISVNSSIVIPVSLAIILEYP